MHVSYILSVLAGRNRGAGLLRYNIEKYVRGPFKFRALVSKLAAFGVKCSFQAGPVGARFARG